MDSIIEFFSVVKITAWEVFKKFIAFITMHFGNYILLECTVKTTNSVGYDAKLEVENIIFYKNK